MKKYLAFLIVLLLLSILLTIVSDRSRKGGAPVKSGAPVERGYYAGAVGPSVVRVVDAETDRPLQDAVVAIDGVQEERTKKPC